MMKKLLLASTVLAGLTAAASAADLPRRAPPPVFTPVPVFTWTGFYAGVESAYTFTDRERIRTFGGDAGKEAFLTAGGRPRTTFTETDGIAKLGGGFGYNYQFTPGTGFVVGVAANWDWTDIHKNRFFLGTPQGPAPLTPSAYRQSLEWLGTATVKLGYAFDRFLVYGTGGYAYGGGVEYAIPADSFLNYLSLGKYIGLKSEAVTIKAEYLHYDLGSRTLVLPAVPGVGSNFYAARFRTEGNIVRAGFNYKFGGL